MGFRHRVLLATMLFATWAQQSEARSAAACTPTLRVEVESPGLGVDDAKALRAACVALTGGTVQGAERLLPNPLPVKVVDDFHGQRLNAQYINPGLFDPATGRVEITRDLLDTYDENGLAFVMAHEISHRLNRDGTRIHGLLALRNVFGASAAMAPALFLKRRRRMTTRRLQLAAFALGVLLAVLAWTVSTVGIAAMNTRYEYSADRRGLELLVSAGWTPVRALDAFRAFMAKNGNRVADSWFSENRHPSDADRARAAGLTRSVAQVSR